MQYLPEDVADLDGYGFYEEDRHNPLVMLYAQIVNPPERPFSLYARDWHGTFKMATGSFTFATFDEFVKTYDEMRAAVLKPWE